MNLNRILDLSVLYRLWQYPFVQKKFKPILESGDISRCRSVLDVGCGPGTNAAWFHEKEYLGIDINPGYIASARSRYGDKFLVADVTNYSPIDGRRFDFILMNSLLHHLTDDEAYALLRSVACLLSNDGFVHILDLILPSERSISRFLALADRGEHPRPLERWKELFTSAFDSVTINTYAVGLGNVALWNMVYFKGKRKDGL